MNSSFNELTKNEKVTCNGGGVGLMLLFAGGAMAAGTGIGWGIGYFLG